MSEQEIKFINQNIGIFCCPKCNGELDFKSEIFRCLSCNQIYQIHNDVPSLFWPNEWSSSKEDVTEKIKSFYEENPFPNYDDFDNAGSLLDKARKSIFAKLLDDQVPFGSYVLDCGCGTGQFTNFLSIGNRTVIGTDICLNSLRLAQEFKNINDLERAHFYQMNLFRPCFKPHSFDLVISNGVLHHTSNPLLAFKSISTLVKPQGFILVGLYHKYGRLLNDLRRIIFKLSKDKLKFLDSRTINENVAKAKRDSLFMDQYKNPHESKHTFGEVLKWLKDTEFTFINSVPKTTPFTDFYESELLFQPNKPGNVLQRFVVNIGMIFSGHSEGGFFFVIAKKSNF